MKRSARWLFTSLMFGSEHVRTGHHILMVKTPTLRNHRRHLARWERVGADALDGFDNILRNFPGNDDRDRQRARRPAKRLPP